MIDLTQSTPPRRVLSVKTKGTNNILSPDLEDMFKSDPRPRRPTRAPDHDNTSAAKTPRISIKKMEPLKIISPRPPALVPTDGGGPGEITGSLSILNANLCSSTPKLFTSSDVTTPCGRKALSWTCWLGRHCERTRRDQRGVSSKSFSLFFIHSTDNRLY